VLPFSVVGRARRNDTRACPTMRFVIGGRGITGRVRAQPGIEVCGRVSDVVEAADALVKRADLN